MPNDASQSTLAVDHPTPGTLILRLGAEMITATMRDRPRVALALESLRLALETEARIARDGPGDMARWIGAFRFEEPPHEEIW